MLKSSARTAVTIASIAVLTFYATRAQAIDINLTYRSAGQSIGGIATAAGQPSNAQGGGDLQTIVNLAAQYWESTFLDTHTVNIEYGWAPITSAGSHSLLTEGGSPHRETAGAIRFDSDLTTFWFIDSSPLTNSEFTTFTTYTQNLGGGTMTTGLEYTGGSGAAGNFDLLTTAIHEIGHALGLSAANDAYSAESSGDFEIDLVAPRAFPGAAIPVETGSAHINLLHPLLRSSRPDATRRFASEADILALAQISQFTQVNLNPSIPEPTAAGASLILAALACTRRRRS